MKLPRWLSPVRMVEAETGWPRAVCRRLMYSPLVCRAGALFDWMWLFVAACICAMMLFGGFDIGRSLAEWFGLEGPAATAFMALCLAIWGSVGLAVPLVISFEMRRRARRFVAAPWCFKCEYPILPPGGREGRAYSICPECGEPIPPEIAALAAQRKADSA